MNARILAATMLLALACAGGGQAQQQPPKQDPAYAKLASEFQAAQQSYFEPYRKAKSEEEAAKITLDPAKEPVKLFIPKFQALAAKNKGNEAGAQALAWIVQNAGQRAMVEPTRRALAELTASYIASPRMEQVAQALPWTNGIEAEAVAAAKLMLAKSPHARVKAAALSALAEGYASPYGSWKKDPAQARACLVQLKEKYADTPYAKRAADFLFELDNLQIGQTAPDFTGTDENGTEFKLTDYRGKVVILDFWGFW